MKTGTGGMASYEHEAVYHAAWSCQGKQSGLTAPRCMVRSGPAQLKAKQQAILPLKKAVG